MIREDWLEHMIDKLRPDFQRVEFAAAGEDSRLVRLPLEGPRWRTRPAASASAGALSRAKTSRSRSSSALCSERGRRSPATLVHELVHMCRGHRVQTSQAVHKVAKAIGLEGKMTATIAGAALIDRLKELIDELGEYPHARLVASKSRRRRPRGCSK